MTGRTRVVATARRAAGPLVDLVRTGRPVAWTPPWMGFGNQALLWFWAWRGRARAEERSVLRTPAMEPWLDLFPAAAALTTARSDVGFRDRRPNPVHLPGDRDVPPHTPDWTPRELAAFVEEVFLSSTAFEQRRSVAGIGDDDLVVNVRRGDYYSAANVGRWGFDQAGYVRAAVTLSAARAPVDRVVVVSDDLDWCSRELSWAPAIEPRVHLVPASDGPAANLATLVSGRRLVATNSTFSYWGGYIGDVLHGARREVVAPAFFDRSQNGGRAWLLDPAWTALEEPSEGWAGYGTATPTS